MDPALIGDLSKLGVALAFAVIAVRWLAQKYDEGQKRMQERADQTEKRCDEERQRLQDIVEKLRDQQTEDQRDLLRTASTALSNNAKALEANANAFSRLVELHERRESGSGSHPTKG